jgi:hypothetical protein
MRKNTKTFTPGTVFDNSINMLQNRVHPSGKLIKTKARGSLMGTRGLLHNDKQQIVRVFKLKTWITCKLEFKGRRRKVMTPNLYTELFFLDEATAFSAGHRPCAECRRESFNLFKQLWLAANPAYGFNIKTPIHKIDEIIHAERIDQNNRKVTFEERISGLPDGTFILVNDEAFLVASKKMYRWTEYGYENSTGLSATAIVTVLTPRSIVNTFRAGYVPQISSLS